MSGAFIIDGKILDPSKENTTFENLMLDQQSEIVLVTWLDWLSKYTIIVWQS